MDAMVVLEVVLCFISVYNTLKLRFSRYAR